MPRLKQSSIEAVRQRVSLLDVAQQYTPMKRAGSQWRGLSPFSPEKTPSFFVHPEKNVFMDYSSGHAGDLFRFMELKENLSFMEAIETLARRYHIDLEYEQGGEGSAVSASLRKELFAIHELATDYFHQCFMGTVEGADRMRDYWINQRGFTVELAQTFGIGFAPARGRELLERIRKQKVSIDAIRQCGLFFLRDNESRLERALARFRGRLMIPIRDVQGRVVAFTARKTELTPQDDPAHEAKYVNSPETPIFSKSRLLFNLDRARKTIDQVGRFLLVEGQLDALRCWDSGLTTAVAPQGTAITDEQLGLLRRYTSNVEVLLDGDAAGKRAAFRMLPKALKAGLDVTFLPLEPGQDPDDLVRAGGAAAIESLREHAQSAMQLSVNTLLPDLSAVTPREKAAALEQIYSILAHIDSQVVRDDYLHELATLTRSDVVSLKRDAQPVLQGSRQPKRATDAPATETMSAPRKMASEKIVTVEEETLIVGFNYSYLFAQALAYLDPSWIATNDRAGRLLAQMLYDYSENVWDGAEDFIERQEDPETRSYISQLAEMGICVLDFRCDGDFMRRDRSKQNTDNITWDADEALRHFVVTLLKKHVDAEIQRLDAIYLNLQDADNSQRQDILMEKRRIRSAVANQGATVAFAA